MLIRFLVVVLVLWAPTALSAKGDLQIYFIDTEGGAATLIVSPTGESLLIDAGYGRTTRDPERIMTAVRDARLKRLDYLLVTHFHPDHVGGIPELSTRIPIGTFIDYGGPMGTPFGADRMTTRSFSLYEPVRSLGRQLTPKPGDQLPLTGVEATVVSSGGALLTTPLAGGGQLNDACATEPHHPDDGTENFRSVGIHLRHGAFSFVALGDLSGETLDRLVCPRNLIGSASTYLIPHHGDYDSNSPEVYAALKPRVAIMNNGATKGGDPAAFKTVNAQAGTDLWQLHRSTRPHARNSPEPLIANLDDENCAAHWIKLAAKADGTFTIENGRTGLVKAY